MELIFIAIGIAIGWFARPLVADARRRMTNMPRHQDLHPTTRVWFPHEGRWTLGTIHGPVDATREHYRVRDFNDREAFEVAFADLRLEEGRPLTEPVPAPRLVDAEENDQ